jgi:outer membrane lipase/esterase
MRSFDRSALALALALIPGYAAAQFTGAVVFGDSLSDAGQYGSRATTNPGITAAMGVAEAFGFVVTPSFQGGTAYAQSGARVNSPSLTIPPTAPNFSIAQQVTQFLAAGPVDPNALIQIQGGANDILQLAFLASTGAIPPAQVQSGVVQAALDLATQVARLKAAGARFVVLYNAPDIGTTPRAAAAGPAGQASFTALSDLFNTTLAAAVRGAGLEVIPLNTFKLIQEVVANPAAFGFVNATTPVCTTSDVLQCTPSTLRDPQGAQTWVFADTIHPTTAMHAVAAAAAVATIRAPQQIAVLAEAPLAVEKANFRAIDGRMLSSVGAPRPTNKYDVWVTYDYSNPDLRSGFLDGDADLNSVTVGVDAKLSDALIVGGAFGWTENKGDFGSGGYKLNEASGTLYAGYGMGPWYVGGSLGVGDLDYTDVHRDIRLNALTRTESGETRGTHVIGRVLGGAWLRYNNLLHGPIVKYTWQDIKVRAFQENGSDSTVLAYAQQNRRSSILSAGWQVTGTLGSVRPYARALWENELNDGERIVTATAPGVASFAVPAYRADRDWAHFDVGAAMDFGRFTGFVTGSATAGKSDGDAYGVTVGVRVPL